MMKALMGQESQLAKEQNLNQTLSSTGIHRNGGGVVVRLPPSFWEFPQDGAVGQAQGSGKRVLFEALHRGQVLPHLRENHSNIPEKHWRSVHWLTDKIYPFSMQTAVDIFIMNRLPYMSRVELLQLEHMGVSYPDEVGADDEAHPIRFDKDESVIGPRCHSSCSMVYCKSPLLGTNFPAKHVGCVFHEVLKWEVRVELVKRAHASHFVQARPRIYTTLVCASGALFKEPIQSVPGIYNYNCDYALEGQDNALYVPYSKTAIDRGNLTAQMVGHLANLNRYGEIRHVSLTNPVTDNLSRPSDAQQFPRAHRENEDWLIMDSAKSDRDPITHHEALSIKLEKQCPYSDLCGKMKTDSNTITAHILLHHGEWALAGAKVRCPTCMEPSQIVPGPTGFSHHWVTTHSSFEMFSNVENITGLGPRVKFGMAANIIALTAVAAANRITAAGGNSITIPERHYSKAGDGMLIIPARGIFDEQQIDCARGIPAQSVETSTLGFHNIAAGFRQLLGEPSSPLQPRAAVGSSPPPPPPCPASGPEPVSKPGPAPTAEQAPAPGGPQLQQPIGPETKRMLDEYIDQKKDKQRAADKLEKLAKRTVKK